jgi:L-ascorbate metabolism protein UlaG (beta-lactamase superfamily)
MEPEMAARAAKTVRAKLIIPHHYATYPILTQDPKRFMKALDEKGIRSKIMQPGTSLTFKGKELATE